MTLIGAFSTLDGAVLFADGQETIPNYAKFEVDKIYCFEAQGEFRALMAAAGPSDGIEMLWARVCAGLKGSASDPTSDGAKHLTRIAVGAVVSAHDVKSVIVNTAIEFAKECIFPLPESSRAYAEVAAIWVVQRLSGEGIFQQLKPTAIFRTQGLWVLPVDRHYFVGSPVLLARYIADSYLGNYLLTTEEAEALAAFILWEAGSYDPDCGKQSDIIVLKHNGEMRWVPRQEVKYWEEHFALYKKVQRIMPILTCAGKKAEELYERDASLNNFMQAIRFLAQEQCKMREQGGNFPATLEQRLVKNVHRKRSKPSTSRKSEGQQ